MLISLSISNFRSFFTEQTFSMVASKRQSDHGEHLVPIPGQSDDALPLAVIYGANGSGKSNLVNSLRFVEALVLRGTKPNEDLPLMRFRLAKKGEETPGSFEVRFVNKGKVFSLGFTLDNDEIKTEWLSLVEGDREVSIYERKTSEGKVIIEGGPGLERENAETYAKVSALIQLGVRANQPFITAVRENIDKVSQGESFRAALDWFETVLNTIGPEAQFKRFPEWISGNELFTQFLGEFLSESSTGISGVRSRKIKIPNGGEDADDLLKTALKKLKDRNLKSVPLGDSSDNMEVISEGDDYSLRVIKSLHKVPDQDDPIEMFFDEESDGTKRIAHLLPALFSAKSGNRVYIIDELDRSLHPLLAKKFLECFLKFCKAGGSQLIVTTHESNLMDLDILRRDELWFVEKNEAQESTIYSLADFNVRKDLKIDRGYLQGRFGAIPFLGNLDRLCEAKCENS